MTDNPYQAPLAPAPFRSGWRIEFRCWMAGALVVFAAGTALVVNTLMQEYLGFLLHSLAVAASVFTPAVALAFCIQNARDALDAATTEERLENQ